jgi:nucleoside-diphosphate-sugar epimerase
MKILVTGGLGLIGHNVVANLQNHHDVSVIDNKTDYGSIPHDELFYLLNARHKKINEHPIHTADVQDTVEINWLIKKIQPEIIIHLASYPRQKLVGMNPVHAAEVMTCGLINILEAAKTYQTRRVVFISSSMVYGDFTDQVIEDAVCAPQGQYGILKLAGEWLVKDYARRHGIEYTIIRPSAVYGPLDVEDRVVAKFMLSAMRKQNLNVNGANETLDFTFVDDAAQGIVAAALSEQTVNKTYNITKSHSVSLLSAAEMIVKIVGSGNIITREKDRDFPSRGALNIAAARRDFGFEPKVDVEEGFRRYYNWLSKSPYWASRI